MYKKKKKESLIYRTFIFFKKYNFKNFNNIYLLLVSPKNRVTFFIFFPQVFPHFYLFLIKTFFFKY